MWKRGPYARATARVTRLPRTDRRKGRYRSRSNGTPPGDDWADISYDHARRPNCKIGVMNRWLLSDDGFGFSVKPLFRWDKLGMMEQADTAPGYADHWDNPMGTDGFEFIEYTAPDAAALGAAFEQLGFAAVARHRSKKVTLYRQGEINFIVNAEPESFAQAFARLHGPSVCAIAFRVHDAAAAYRRALALGARPVMGKVGPMELTIPAIEGIGGSLLYFVDRYGDHTIYDVDFLPLGLGDAPPALVGLGAIDHLTHNVHQGRMTEWARFYERLFNFRETRYFDIEGKLTGLRSKAMTSPCGKIRIPINESADARSQIAEYLAAYRGAAARPWRGPRAADARPHSDRRRAGVGKRAVAADLHRYHDRSDLLRDH